ncbi:hypothetical protein K1T71_006703 [Dendrolimus kikuchii]|uniref:Uncharacterized protein n=1 Tax=Dendrolimus kikuchii TaxID=765133 RepID=A0ACC1D269_9NEOP|nr:hypothetical protein K1T71_006703 [Dendrolimus kikuchii]
METSGYDNIKADDSSERKRDNVKTSWKPFWRQLFVSSGVWSIYFVLGLGFGTPTVMIPQIRKEANSTEAVSDEMASWLSSVHGYSALPWVFIIPIFTKYVGRKIPFILVCINTLVGFIIFYCSVNTTYLLISAIMQGMLLASNMTLLVVIVTEYSSPRYRGVFMIIESTFFFWGVWIANAIGTFSHWKNIGIIAFICSIYPLTAIMWPESPYWLAMKGRFDECVKSHHWLKGYDKDSEFELETLISSQREYQKSISERKKFANENRLKSIMATITTKAFYMPLILSVCVMSMYHFSEKQNISVFFDTSTNVKAALITLSVLIKSKIRVAASSIETSK